MAEHKGIATSVAERISKQYNVSVEILETDNEYYSPETVKRSAETDVFYISSENPEATGRATETLLNFKAAAYTRWTTKQYEAANAKRIEVADSKSLSLSEKIKEIAQLYKTTNNGREPSLNMLADRLNEHNKNNEDKIEPPQGGPKWYAQTVKRVLERSSNLGRP